MLLEILSYLLEDGDEFDEAQEEAIKSLKKHQKKIKQIVINFLTEFDKEIDDYNSKYDMKSFELFKKCHLNMLYNEVCIQYKCHSDNISVKIIDDQPIVSFLK